MGAPIVRGTALYAGSHGTLQITESFGFVGSTDKSGAKEGQCNMSNSAPTLAPIGAAYASRSVSF